jgi:hypothetical protein
VVKRAQGRSQNSPHTQDYTENMALLNVTFPSIISELMHRALNIVQSWHRAKEPSVNPDKTKHLLFIKNRVDRFIASDLLNKVIPPTGPVEYVGVIQNAKLTWLTLPFGYVVGPSQDLGS